MDQRCTEKKGQSMLRSNRLDFNDPENSSYLQSNDMRMGAHFEDVNFSANFLCHLHMFNLSLVQNFHSDFLTRDDVMSHCQNES